jgi:uncharacterized protein DUF922
MGRVTWVAALAAAGIAYAGLASAGSAGVTLVARGSAAGGSPCPACPTDPHCVIVPGGTLKRGFCDSVHEESVCMSADGAVSPAALEAASSQSCPYRHRLFAQSFRSCSDYAHYMGTHYAAESRWSLLARPVGQPSGGSGGTYTIQYLIADGSYVADPRPTWPHMTTNEQRALAETLAALSAHEHGHLQLVTRYIRAHPTERFDATTTAQAQDEIQRRLDAYENEVQHEQDEYDAVTDHGIHQSLGPQHGFPGGNDTVLRCP